MAAPTIHEIADDIITFLTAHRRNSTAEALEFWAEGPAVNEREARANDWEPVGPWTQEAWEHAGEQLRIARNHFRRAA